MTGPRNLMGGRENSFRRRCRANNTRGWFVVVAAGVVAPHGGRAVDLGRVRADLAERGGRPDGRTVRPRPAAAGAEHGRRLRSVG